MPIAIIKQQMTTLDKRQFQIVKAGHATTCQEVLPDRMGSARYLEIYSKRATIAGLPRDRHAI